MTFVEQMDLIALPTEFVLCGLVLLEAYAGKWPKYALHRVVATGGAI